LFWFLLKFWKAAVPMPHREASVVHVSLSSTLMLRHSARTSSLPLQLRDSSMRAVPLPLPYV
jgi:hypothetical protein